MSVCVCVRTHTCVHLHAKEGLPGVLAVWTEECRGECSQQRHSFWQGEPSAWDRRVRVVELWPGRVHRAEGMKPGDMEVAMLGVPIPAHHTCPLPLPPPTCLRGGAVDPWGCNRPLRLLDNCVSAQAG